MAVKRGFLRSSRIFMCEVDSPVRQSATCLSPRLGLTQSGGPRTDEFGANRTNGGEETKHIENPCDENSCAALPPSRDGNEDIDMFNPHLKFPSEQLDKPRFIRYPQSSPSEIHETLPIFNLRLFCYTALKFIRKSLPSGQTFPVFPIERPFRNFFPSAIIRIFICQFICNCSAAHIRNDSERPHTACTIQSLYPPSGGIHEAIFRITIHPSA